MRAPRVLAAMLEVVGCAAQAGGTARADVSV
jgi:hypothetical protein